MNFSNCWSRRSFLLATSALLGSLTAPAEAVPLVSFAGVVTSLITTMTIANTSGSAQSAPFVSPMFGHAFKKGDIPAGQYPQFKQADTTLCPMTMWEPVYWSDGSLKFAGFLIRVPTAGITGNGSITISIFNGGSAPTASGRSTADVVNAGIVVNATGLDNISGSWTCAAADLTRVTSYADGAAGRIFKIGSDFKQAGSPHKQLVTDHYVAVLNDNSGGLGGFRYLPRITQPWYNAAALNSAPAASWRGFSALNFQYGAGPTTVDLISTYISGGNPTAGNISGSNVAIANGGTGFAANSSFVMTLSGGTFSIATQFNVTTNSSGVITAIISFAFAGSYSVTPGTNGLATTGGTGTGFTVNMTWSPITWTQNSNGYEVGQPIRLSSSGALPTGFIAGNTYFVYPLTANTFQLLTGPYAGAQIAVTDVGTGTFTITPTAYLQHFGSYFGAKLDGRWWYLQAQGSVASDSTTQIQFNKTYQRSTRIIPPYDTTIGTVVSNTSINWNPYSFGKNLRFVGSGGERDEIGVISMYQARHFWTQALVDEQNARIHGLAITCLSTNCRDWTSKSLVNLGNPGNSYSGMPSSTATTMEFRPSSALQGITVPTSPAGGIGNLISTSANTSEHMPSFGFYPYLITGEPVYEDILAEEGNMGLLAYPMSDRNRTVNAVLYYGGQLCGRDTIRACAWSSRQVAQAAGMIPVTMADGIQVGKYFRDLVDDNAKMNNAFTLLQSSWYQNNGFFMPAQNQGYRSVWQVNYCVIALCHSYALSENANVLTLLQQLGKWPPYVKTTYTNSFMLDAYYERVWTNQNTNTIMISTDADWGGYPNNGNLSWTNASPGVFTFANSQLWTITAGDKIIFEPLTVQDIPISPPTGFNTNTPFYVVNPNGLSFNLAATPGGAALPTSNTGSVPGDSIFVTTNSAPAAAGGIGGAPTQTNNATSTYAAYNYATAVGITGLASVNTELAGWMSGVNFTSLPKYAIATNF